MDLEFTQNASFSVIKLPQHLTRRGTWLQGTCIPSYGTILVKIYHTFQRIIITVANVKMILYRGAGKSLTRQGNKLEWPNSDFCKPLKKNSEGCPSKPGLRSSNDLCVGRKMATFQLFSVFSRVGLRTYQHPCNRELSGKFNILLLVRIYSSSLPLFAVDNMQMFRDEYQQTQYRAEIWVYLSKYQGGVNRVNPFLVNTSVPLLQNIMKKNFIKKCNEGNLWPAVVSNYSHKNNNK